MDRLAAELLRREQDKTLNTPRMRYGLLARALFLGMDLAYGRARTLSKFKILELIARVPYQAWEQVGYVAMTHMAGDPGFARRVYERVHESRVQQDNEQWHLLILTELVDRRGIREGRLMFCEDHAEHESMFAADYGRYASPADVFRQIGYDERVHKEESLRRVAEPRFS